MDKSESIIEADIFSKGNRGPSDYFTGTSWVTILVRNSPNLNYSVGNVVFEPGAKTNWNTHTAGQTLLITAGQGFYQEKGKVAQPLKKGDVVNIPADIDHWHRVSGNASLVHIAISNYKDGINVTWLKPVSEEEYRGIHQ